MLCLLKALVTSFGRFFLAKDLLHQASSEKYGSLSRAIRWIWEEGLDCEFSVLFALAEAKS
jgi:hypothetical protein